jgi:murein DD-endopeptidase MepM/ murein hydrolase activator NlpD
MPLDTAVSTAYGTRRIFNHKHESIHRGMDLRGTEGAPVHACNAGKVVMTDDLFFGGRTLVIDHGMGIFSLYMHLSGFASAPGDAVNKGDVIGYVGATGRSSGPHLHFGVKVRGISVNPASLMNLEL